MTGRATLAIAVAWLFGCAPTLVWTGHSPDRRRTVQVLARGSSQYVVVDGARGPGFSGIAVETITFSPDSGRLAYAAQQGTQWAVVVDGARGPLFDGIGQVSFGPDGRRLAYAAERDGSWHMVVDGEAGPAFDALMKDSLVFSADGRRVAYVGARRQFSHVIVDGNVGPAYHGVAQLSFSDDGARFVYLGRAEDAAYAVIDGEPGEPWEQISEIAAGATGRVAFAARRGDRWRVVVDGVEGTEHLRVRAIIFSTNGERLAWIAGDGAAEWVVSGGGEGHARYDAIDRLGFSPDGQHLAYAARANGRWQIVLDGSARGSFDGVVAIVFSHSGRRWAYTVREGNRSALYVDDERITDHDWIGAAVFDPQGSRLGYLAIDDATAAAVVDGRRYAQAGLFAGSLVFSSDGARWACAASDADGRVWVVIDGRKARELDIVELFELAMASPVDTAVAADEGALLRPIVAAELARGD